MNGELSYAVIGLGRFGFRLAASLADSGAEVLAIDNRREHVEAIRDRVSLAVCLDSTDESALRSQGIEQIDLAVVGIGADFESAVLTTVLLKQIGVPRVLSRATSSIRAKILQGIGADEIINPEQESADRWHHRLLAPSISDRIELAEGFSLSQIGAPESFIGKTLEDLQIRRKYRVNVVAIRHDIPEEQARRTGKPLVSVPLPDTPIQDGDALLVMGSDEAIRSLPTQ